VGALAEAAGSGLVFCSSFFGSFAGGGGSGTATFFGFELKSAAYDAPIIVY
jgi:hypothetical protein